MGGRLSVYGGRTCIHFLITGDYMYIGNWFWKLGLISFLALRYILRNGGGWHVFGLNRELLN